MFKKCIIIIIFYLCDNLTYSLDKENDTIIAANEDPFFNHFLSVTLLKSLPDRKYIYLKYNFILLAFLSKSGIFLCRVLMQGSII